MLISYRHKFIFVHIYKNAGTSIINAMMPFCIPRWQLIKKVRLRSRWQERVNRLAHGLFGSPDPQPCSHSKATEIIARLGSEVFTSHYSFAVIRNPWDWQVSLYSYMLKSKFHYQHLIIKELGSFENYIRWRCVSDNIELQKDFVYGDDGKSLVKNICRYETLNTDFHEVCNKIGIHATLPKLNVSNTTPYKNYYNAETRELVRDTFKGDIQLFGYEF